MTRLWNTALIVLVIPVGLLWAVFIASCWVAGAVRCAFEDIWWSE